MFGVVPDKGLQRRPTEIIRIFVGLLLVLLGAINATTISPIERSVHSTIVNLPSVILTSLRWMNTTGSIVALGIMVVAALASRRPRFIGVVALAAALTVAAGRLLEALHVLCAFACRP
jgi:hypothetical protein